MNFKRILREPAARWMAGMALLAGLAPHATASGICLTADSNLYSGGILGTAPAPFIAGCTFGLTDNTGSLGGVVTTTPSSLPSPISMLTAASLSFSDPLGNLDSASASLNAGTLGAFDNGSVPGGGNGASAALNDTIHFHVVGGTSVPILFSVHLSGTEAGSGIFDNNFSLTFVGVLGFQMDNLGGHPNDFNVSSDPGWGTFSGASQNGFNYSGTITVTDGEAIPITEALSLACVSGETCDFSHTAAVSFTLPSNVTFTSDSGVFLTQAGSVPEPASIALVGAGLAALMAFRKRAILRGRRP